MFLYYLVYPCTVDIRLFLFCGIGGSILQMNLVLEYPCSNVLLRSLVHSPTVALSQSSCHFFSICIFVACISRLTYTLVRCFAMSLSGFVEVITPIIVCGNVLYAKSVQSTFFDLLSPISSKLFRSCGFSSRVLCITILTGPQWTISVFNSHWLLLDWVGCILAV